MNTVIISIPTLPNRGSHCLCRIPRSRRAPEAEFTPQKVTVLLPASTG